VEEKRLPFRALLLWEGYAALGAGLLLLAVFLFLSSLPFIYPLSAIVIGVFYLIAALGYLPLFYKRFCCGYDEEMIFLKSGVFYRRESVLFRCQLVTVSVVRSPLTLLLGLAFLRCAAPGGGLTLPFLSAKEAFRLQRALLGGGAK